MKRVILFSILFILMCFSIPVIFTKNVTTIKDTIMQQETFEEEKKDIKDEVTKDNTIVRLLHSSTGEIEEIYLDEYLYGVVSAEMPANFEIEALKAQAIVARTYTKYNMKEANKHDNADICDDASCCQAWISKDERLSKWEDENKESNWDKIVNAVDSTSGIIITYEGKPINAFFHANSGGITETASNVWGGEDYPYLQNVETSMENEYTQYSSQVILTKGELIDALRKYHNDVNINFEEENTISILERNNSGRVMRIRFGNIEISGVETRKIFNLKSTNFDIVVGENIIFNVIGYGHGVGLSQTGANSMAKLGNDFEEIIKHYYSGVALEKINVIE